MLVAQTDDSLPVADDSQVDSAVVDSRVDSVAVDCSASADFPAEGDSQANCSCPDGRSLLADSPLADFPAARSVDYLADFQLQEAALAWTAAQ